MEALQLDYERKFPGVSWCRYWEFNSTCVLSRVSTVNGLADDESVCCVGFWHLQVTGMECAACAGSIEKAVKRLLGIEEATVSVLQNRAQVVYRPAFVQVCFPTLHEISNSLSLQFCREPVGNVGRSVKIIGALVCCAYCTRLFFFHVL